MVGVIEINEISSITILGIWLAKIIYVDANVDGFAVGGVNDLVNRCVIFVIDLSLMITLIVHKDFDDYDLAIVGVVVDKSHTKRKLIDNLKVW